MKYFSTRLSMSYFDDGNDCCKLTREQDVDRFVSLSAKKFRLPQTEVSLDKQWSSLSIGVGDSQRTELYATPFTTLKQYDNGSLIYRRIKSGLCEFFATCPIGRGGFGGRTFKFPMDDGTTLRCGAWSSNPGAINEFLVDHQIIDIYTICDGFKTWGLALDVAVAHYALVHWSMENHSPGDRRPHIAEVSMYDDGSRNWSIVWYDEDLRCYWDRPMDGKRLETEGLTFPTWM